MRILLSELKPLETIFLLSLIAHTTHVLVFVSENKSTQYLNTDKRGSPPLNDVLCEWLCVPMSMQIFLPLFSMLAPCQETATHQVMSTNKGFKPGKCNLEQTQKSREF